VPPSPPQPVSGHIWCREGKRGAVFYVKYRRSDGRQVQRRLGPAWTQGGYAPRGHLTPENARAALEALLAPTRPPSTFAGAAEEWLAYCEDVRDCKPSTLRDYGNMVRVLNRRFGERRLETICAEEIETWARGLAIGNRTRQKYIVCLGSIFKRAVKRHGLATNPVDFVERPRVRPSAQINVLLPGQVAALIEAAADEQDAALIATAAMAGLRIGEILALRWRDVEVARRTIHVRENWTHGETTTPKSGTERAVPLADELAHRLGRLRQRAHQNQADDLAFCTVGGFHLGYKSLKRRYRTALRRAGLDEGFRFHDLRHTFGSTVIRRADPREIMEWMGHAELRTTSRYLAFIDRADAARRVSAAFSEAEGP
jgi:integrase